MDWCIKAPGSGQFEDEGMFDAIRVEAVSRSDRAFDGSFGRGQALAGAQIDAGFFDYRILFEMIDDFVCLDGGGERDAELSRMGESFCVFLPIMNSVLASIVRDGPVNGEQHDRRSQRNREQDR